MSDIQKLIERLRSAHSNMTPGAIERADIDGIAFTIEEAAQALAALLARLDSAEKALKPFSDELDDWSSIENDGYEYDEDYPLSDRDGDLTVGHLRAARAHLSQYGERT